MKSTVVFLAADDVRVPPVCVFTSDEEVRAFQQAATIHAEVFGSDVIELQPAAMATLLEACADAHTEGLAITPRGGAEAARRGFDDTLRLWESRFLPALDYWCVQQHRLAPEQKNCCPLTPGRRLRRPLKLEGKASLQQGFFQERALPCAARSLQESLDVAFDLPNFAPRCRILARNGWFQTVTERMPHFITSDR